MAFSIKKFFFFLIKISRHQHLLIMNN